MSSQLIPAFVSSYSNPEPLAFFTLDKATTCLHDQPLDRIAHSANFLRELLPKPRSHRRNDFIVPGDLPDRGTMSALRSTDSNANMTVYGLILAIR